MVFLVCAAVVLYSFWLLLKNGVLWGIIIFSFAWVGMHNALYKNTSFSHNPLITIAGINFSGAEIIPTIIIFLFARHVDN